MNNDLTFFTNDENSSLLDRFKRVLKGVKTLDILVGYFRASGFNLMKESLDKVEKIRILVGIDVDREVNQWWKKVESKFDLILEADKDSKRKAIEAVLKEVESEENYNQQSYNSIQTFIKFILDGKLEIRAYKKGKIHAKVYVIKYDEEVGTEYGKVITGSSNFSYSGLVGNREFNIELKNKSDIDFASEQFEDLWEDGVDISDEFVSIVKTKTWLKDDVTPYELYMKLLYEYFYEELNDDQKAWQGVPDNYFKLHYQQDAVIEAERKLKKYGGVFLSDVVGLGKTYIAAMLAKKIGGRNLVICPPVLMSNWKNVLNEFGVGNREVYSRGMLHKILEDGKDYDNVFIDESHYFRNQKTQAYDMLDQITTGRNVILISATPQNNYPKDIESQIYLFQNKKKSDIEGVHDLEEFFGRLDHKVKEAEKQDKIADDKKNPKTLKAIKENSKEIREKLLNRLMVRRTRGEIKKNFGKDFETQGLKFPEINQPVRVFYQFDKKLDSLFEESLNLIKEFKYARYSPAKYLKDDINEFSDTELQVQDISQKNLTGFMKGLLIKRLDSSFYAFHQTLLRFKSTYERFINMYEEQGFVATSKKVNIYDLLEEDDFDKLEELVSRGSVIKYLKKDLKKEYLEDLKSDYAMLDHFIKLWTEFLYDEYTLDNKFKIKDDPKLSELSRLIEEDENFSRKVIIFTEAADTSDYLYDRLSRIYGDKVIVFSGKSSDSLKSKIERNFNPDVNNQDDQYRILITTDILAEGISLHRANLIVNYDIPWNPTRVLQRVGRINRVGSNFDDIYIYNFFPTVTSESELGLEKNALKKIHAFHHTLGEDAKYLSENEDLVSHELFEKVNSKEYIEGEEGGNIRYKYLNIIRKLRDNSPELFEKVKNLPKRISSSRSFDSYKGSVITFFRKGELKKFFINGIGISKDLKFEDAVKIFSCRKDEQLMPLLENFFDLVDENKRMFRDELNGPDEGIVAVGSNKGKSNRSFAMSKLALCKNSLVAIKDDKGKQYLQGLELFFSNGAENDYALKEFRKEAKDVNDPRIIQELFEKHVPFDTIKRSNKKDKEKSDIPTKIILSESIVE